MNSQQILFNFQMQRFDVFTAQDPENGDFDVVFEIDGKKLFAHKSILTLISPTFKLMLSDRWTKSDEPVKIEGYTFENLKEFLTFLYCGECQLTQENIFAMVDIAEYFGIKAFKDVCEEYLIKSELNLENIYQMMELANKYSLTKFKKSVKKFTIQHIGMVFGSAKFLNLQKSMVQDLVKANQETQKHEEIFECVFKWAENRSLEKQKQDESLDLNETIKMELTEILPLIKFEKMKNVFFIKFVAKKSFLFSGEEWSDILWSRNKLFVKVIDGNGKIMKGEIHSDDVVTIANVIGSLKYEKCEVVRDFLCQYLYWTTNQPILSTPSTLIENDETKWCLVYNVDGDLCIKRRINFGETDYLLAEMSAKDGFELSESCKIEAHSFI